MKHPFLSFVLCAVCVTPARAGWNYVQTVAAGAAGLNKIELSTAVIDRSLPDLADLRLRTPGGADVPYFTVRNLPPDFVLQTDIREEGKMTVVLADFGKPRDVMGVLLEIPAEEFIKTVNVMGSDTGADWRPVALKKYIFRQGGRAKLQVRFAPVRYRFLRLELDNETSPPVGITQVSAVLRAGAYDRLKKIEIPFSAAQRGKDTVLTLDLPARNLYIAELELTAQDGLYSRQARLVSVRNSFAAAGCVGSGQEPGCGKSFPVRRQFADETAPELIISNGDNPPLAVRSVTAYCLPVYAVFDSPAPAAYKLYFGNRTARAPDYGL
ncbi:MAG: hypothetical protein PHW69_08125, partial [Elusimicrobiaceae bacterium]|nr:hypothetical protein [Elusimicrobiaceae bacterium]